MIRSIRWIGGTSEKWRIKSWRLMAWWRGRMKWSWRLRRWKMWSRQSMWILRVSWESWRIPSWTITFASERPRFWIRSWALKKIPYSNLVDLGPAATPQLTSSNSPKPVCGTPNSCLAQLKSSNIPPELHVPQKAPENSGSTTNKNSFTFSSQAKSPKNW